MHTYMRMGAKGLKLHPNFQRVHPNDPENFELYEEYAIYQLPLIMHSGLTGRERNRKTFSSLEFLETIPRNFPNIPFVLGHAGISQYEKGIALAQKYQNVYLELSGQPARHIHHALSAVGADRLLFGTDWPFWNQAFALQAVRQATKHDHTAERRIFYENAVNSIFPLLYIYSLPVSLFTFSINPVSSSSEQDAGIKIINLLNGVFLFNSPEIPSNAPRSIL